MSFFFGDSFDLYALPSDASKDYWDTTSLNPDNSTLSSGRFAGSRSLNLSTATRLDKVSGQNDAVHHFFLAFMCSNNSGSALGTFFQLFDGTTAQCSVVFRNDGAILLTSGGPAGTILTTYTNVPWTVNVWNTFEIEIVIHNTAGSITIRKNGNPNNDFTQGSLNTRNSANNYANKMQLGSQSVSTHFVDDVLWRSDASSVPWVGDIRCFVRRPASDAQAQFSRTSAAVNGTIWTGIGIYNSPPINNAFYMRVVSPYNGLLSGVSLAAQAGGGTGHAKAAVFSDVSGAIGTVLATSAELTNPAAGGVNFTFSSPTYLTAGQIYWIGWNNDSGAISVNVRSSPPEGLAYINLTSPVYASWPVSNPGGSPASMNVPGLTLVFTPQANSDVVSDLYQDATASYVYSSTNGQNDLYGLSSIAATPASILGVTTRGLFQKSDFGTRNATVQLKSGSTTVQGTNTALNTVWGWVYRNDLVDPATGAAWTVSAVNAVTIGPRVTA